MRKDNDKRIYPMEGEPSIVYLKNVITDPTIEVGIGTYYNDFVNDPRDFEKNNVLYNIPGIGANLKIGKYCSIACGTKFLSSVCHHSKRSLAYYPFPLFDQHWDLSLDSDFDWVEKGPTVVGNDVWFGYDCLIMPGVHIGDGAAIGTRAVVTKDVPPYTVVAGNPARIIKKRFDDKTIAALLELKWWDLPEEEINVYLPDLVYGRLDQVLARKEISDTVRCILSKHFPKY